MTRGYRVRDCAVFVDQEIRADVLSLSEAQAEALRQRAWLRRDPLCRHRVVTVFQGGGLVERWEYRGGWCLAMKALSRAQKELLVTLGEAPAAQWVAPWYAPLRVLRKRGLVEEARSGSSQYRVTEQGLIALCPWPVPAGAVLQRFSEAGELRGLVVLRLRCADGRELTAQEKSLSLAFERLQSLLEAS